jgi:hypothetical protein
MQATSTARPTDHRLVAITLLAASTFGLGAVLGGVAGLAAAPLTAPAAAPAAANSQVIDFSAPALRLQRDGEIDSTAPALDPADKGLRIQRDGETRSAADATGGSATSAFPRYEVTRGK